MRAGRTDVYLSQCGIDEKERRPIMRKNYILIDYESIQPDSLADLNAEHFHVYIFLGQQQTKLSFDLVSGMQKLGTRGNYIKITGNGPNALDFHIAYYIGILSSEDPTAFFHVISKDTGFDPLLAHLKERNVLAARSQDVASIPLLKVANAKSASERIELIIANLRQRGASRPRSVKTLSATIKTLLQNQHSDAELASVLDTLQERKLVVVDGTQVTYQFPNLV